MKILIAFKLAFTSLRLNILRTSLTVLGVVIGAASIVIVFAAGDSLSALIDSEIDSYGSDIIQTEARNPNTSSGLAEITTLKLSDMEAINELPNVTESYATSISQARVSYGASGKGTILFGVGPAYARIDKKTKLQAGRFFNEAEDKSQEKVVVLGGALKETLFGDQVAVDKSVRIGSTNFRVVGVLALQEGGVGFIDFDEVVYIPVNTLQKRILGIDHSQSFVHQLKNPDLAYETADDIKLILRDRHEISDPTKDDFAVSTMDEIANTLGVVTSAVTFLLLAIVLISLAVGGVGIMNIMFVTVTERTPEIGLRKAMGATGSDITWQFLIEAVLITFWGWFLGVVVGVIASYFLIKIAASFGLAFVFSFPWQGILVSFIFSVLCGFLFGFRPAKKAAQLDPVEALRAE